MQWRCFSKKTAQWKGLIWSSQPSEISLDARPTTRITPAQCMNHLKSIFFAINQKIEFFCVTYGFSIYLIRFLLTLACIPIPSARTMTSKVPICFVGAVSTIYARAWITWLYLWQRKRNECFQTVNTSTYNLGPLHTHARNLLPVHILWEPW